MKRLAQRALPKRPTSLTLDPGAGLATPREVSRTAWGGGRMIKPTRSARPVTDQGQLCISSVLGHARLDPINAPRDRDINTSAAAAALTTMLAKRASSFSGGGCQD